MSKIKFPPLYWHQYRRLFTIFSFVCITICVLKWVHIPSSSERPEFSNLSQYPLLHHHCHPHFLLGELEHFIQLISFYPKLKARFDLSNLTIYILYVKRQYFLASTYITFTILSFILFFFFYRLLAPSLSTSPKFRLNQKKIFFFLWPMAA